MKINGPFYIYGAGIVASSIYTALKCLYQQTPICFLVSDQRNNPVRIGDIEVNTVKDVKLEEGCYIVVATPLEFQREICEELVRTGMTTDKLICFSQAEENELMDKYIRHSGLRSVKDIQGNQQETPNKKTIEVYQAKSQYDKMIKNPVVIPAYVRPVQAGAALTDLHLSELRDDVEDSISEKNRNYCELTVTYFAWKHSGADYKGLCHYRRIFDLSEKEIELIMASGDADVILPYPSIHYPDIAGQHMRYVNETDWQAMLQSLEELYPEYRLQWEKIARQQYFYNFNMLIARGEVFDDYCEFLFSVLERTEELTIPRGCERADRFAGYLGENLTTLYFMANKERWKIYHAGKLWMN